MTSTTNSSERRREQIKASKHQVASQVELRQLRELVLGKDFAELQDLNRRLNDPVQRSALVADIISEAISQRVNRDDSLALSLSSTIDQSLHDAIQKDPVPIANAISPIIGPAIRRSIREALDQIIDSLQRILEVGLSMRSLLWRFQAWRAGISYAEFILSKTLIYQVEQVFLIHTETGFLLNHIAADGITYKDPHVISSMRVAINDFVADAFDEHKNVNTLKLDELTLKIMVGPSAILVLAIRGAAPDSLIETQHQTLEKIHKFYGKQLALYKGDGDPFKNTTPLLDPCLQTQCRIPEKKSRWKAWLVVFVALSALAYRWFDHYQTTQYAEQRWQQLVAIVSAEPGLVVVNAFQHENTYRINGLRDAFARQPSSFINASLLAEFPVKWQWSPYISTEKSIINTRVNQTIPKPPGVSWQLTGETLKIYGTAKEQWAESIDNTVLQLSGISTVDKSQLAVQPSAMTQFKTLAQQVDSWQLYFARGESILPEQDQPMITAITKVINELYRLSQTAKLAFSIEVRGHSDQAGSRQFNRSLSRKRTKQVVTAIERQSSQIKQAGLLKRKTFGKDYLSEVENKQLETNRRVDFLIHYQTNNNN